MFAEERRSKIIEILNKDSRLSAVQLAESFRVSVDTIRRDLAIMEEKGLLKRTHGGAIPAQKVRLMPVRNYAREAEADIEPDMTAVAKRAAAFIQAGDTVYIDGAGPHCIMHRYLPSNIRFTVITSSIIIADELRSRDNIDTFLACGKVRSDGNIADALAAEFISTLRLDTAFIASGGVSARHGLSNATSDMMILRRAVASAAKRIICLMPNYRLGAEFLIREIPAEELDMVITDADAPAGEAEKLKQKGINVIIADKDY